MSMESCPAENGVPSAARFEDEEVVEDDRELDEEAVDEAVIIADCEADIPAAAALRRRASSS